LSFEYFNLRQVIIAGPDCPQMQVWGKSLARKTKEVGPTAFGQTPMAALDYFAHVMIGL